MLNMFRMADMQYQQHRHGGGDEEYWDSLRGAMEQSLKMPGTHASWQRQKSILTKSFVQEVEGWGVTPDKSVE